MHNPANVPVVVENSPVEVPSSVEEPSPGHSEGVVAEI